MLFPFNAEFKDWLSANDPDGDGDSVQTRVRRILKQLVVNSTGTETLNDLWMKFFLQEGITRANLQDMWRSFSSSFPAAPVFVGATDLLLLIDTSGVNGLRIDDNNYLLID